MPVGRDDAIHMNLRMFPISPEAFNLVESIGREVWNRSGKKGKRPTRNFLKVMGVILAAILRGASKSKDRYIYRAMGRDTFSGEVIGYRPSKETMAGLASLGLIEVIPGKGKGKLAGTATRLRATKALLSRARDAGVSLEAWQDHFQSQPRPRMIAEPLVLKRDSTSDKGKKVPGAVMPFEPTLREPAALARPVNELNAYFSGVRIEPDDSHYAFQRIFNQGDLPGARWKKGGRLYSLGGGYQQDNSEVRSRMKLNGEAVVELDIRASHLTILHAKLGVAFDPKSDPYDVPGLPRNVVKAWVTMTLGYDRFQSRWSEENKRKYKERIGGELQKDFPIRLVREKVLDALPILRDWPASPVRWGDLQYFESCAVIDAVYELATKHGVPALPVHDSIIVPVSKEKVARETLVKTFHKHIGVTPVLTTK